MYLWQHTRTSHPPDENEETSVLGIETNLALHLVILEDHRFHAGNYDTGLLADLPQSTTTIPNPLDILPSRLPKSTQGNTESRQVTEHTSQWVLQAPSPAGRFELKYFVTINDQEHCVELKKSKDGQYHYTRRRFRVFCQCAPGREATALVNGHSISLSDDPLDSGT